MNGQQFNFYVGPDAHGFIFEDEEGEYINVGNEKRWWRGTLEPIPNILRPDRLNEFGFCSIKPDAFERGLAEFIRAEIESMGLEIIGKKAVLIEKSELFRLYPYFFESEWESVLIKYFCSAPTLFMILRGNQ
ncbi:MAG: nucleoside-diphosphate kinase [Candidatus Moranbacteria bacterium]|nr:nucleoside-diphosphate kinase [Candidatus Moranbacteria bacterium]MDD3964840.1 nucleoside-diphosphate kinase [Candidatus Moranbacteria bacterium]